MVCFAFDITTYREASRSTCDFVMMQLRLDVHLARLVLCFIIVEAKAMDPADFIWCSGCLYYAVFQR